jgi:hypothetical protein
MEKHSRRLEAGALKVGLWLLAIAFVPATAAAGYLPALGAAPLRFQPLEAAGRPPGWPPLPLPDERDKGVATLATNVTTLATKAPAVIATEPTNNPVLSPPITTALPDSSPAPATARFSLPPMAESAPTANTVVDMPSVLSWLLPASTNAPPGNLVFPMFVPATPPLSSQAVYESR